ncbi:MAG: hypothetical protein V3R97_01905, partial [Gemmatimonadales bacterium]
IRSVSLITQAIAETVREVRAQVPVREMAEDFEGETYSTDADADADAERRRRRPRRKRRPKPEAIAAQVKEAEPATSGESGEGVGTPEVAAPTTASAANGDA